MEAIKDEALKVGNLQVETEMTNEGLSVADKKYLWKEKQNAIELNRRKKHRLKLFGIACMISALFILLGFNPFVCWLPIVIHFVLLFYSFSVVFYKERQWKRYVAKYGDANGNIPPHIRKQHLVTMRSGKKISL